MVSDGKKQFLLIYLLFVVENYKDWNIRYEINFLELNVSSLLFVIFLICVSFDIIQLSLCVAVNY